MKKLTALLLAALMLAGVLTACGTTGSSSLAPSTSQGGSSTPPADVAQDLVYAVDAEPAGLDPHLETAHASIRVHKNIYSRLLTQEADLSLSPDLAESYEMSEDGKEYTFALRQGVKFHNGREMVAEDVVYSFDRIRDPDGASVAKNYFKSVVSVEAVDTYSVKFTLDNPDATFLSYLANPYSAIVPKEVVEEYGDLKNNPCGTGPFKMKEYIEGNQIVLERNPDYYDADKVYLNTITYSFITDEASRLAALRTGAAHIAVMPPSQLALVEGNADIVVMDCPSQNYDYLGFNLEKEPFNDVRVRHAISLLVNREEYGDLIYEGFAPITGPVPVSMTRWALDVSGNEWYSNDVEKAKTLLEEAGYPDGFTMTIVAGINQETIDGAQLLKSQLERGGITVEIVVLERAQYIDAWSNFAGSEYDAMIGMNGGGVDPDRSLTFFFNTQSSANVWGYNNPKIDELGAEGKAALTEAARKEVYDEMQEIILEDLPTLFLVVPPQYFFVQSNVEGFVAETYYNDFFIGVKMV